MNAIPENLRGLFAEGSPEWHGFNDALRGHTAAPYGLPDCAKRWAEGYAYASEHGLALYPSFAELTRGKKRRR